MRRILAAACAGFSLAGCAHYHQEVAALRMARPPAEPAELSAYVQADRNYPSVGGDILKGASPKSAAAYEATSGERVPPPAETEPRGR